MRGTREKLQWASSHVTTLHEDIAYSLLGIFGVRLPVIYGEKKQNSLGRLLQEIVAHSGDITGSAMLAAISFRRQSVSQLRHTVAVESTLKLYTLHDSISAPWTSGHSLVAVFLPKNGDSDLTFLSIT
ncbi:hypothetical protein EV702DRAFT_1071617 [Suillus placidus]|uniref:Uncharacterized protein n=1 Tax=Suillus placidus TaxID=48579 RepID=A0A9P7A334_9AGAM|nr:hypothetical protein EV702DRAFT_1071617 [Suillus placidus]